MTAFVWRVQILRRHNNRTYESYETIVVVITFCMYVCVSVSVFFLFNFQNEKASDSRQTCQKHFVCVVFVFSPSYSSIQFGSVHFISCFFLFCEICSHTQGTYGTIGIRQMVRGVPMGDVLLAP